MIHAMSSNTIPRYIGTQLVIIFVFGYLGPGDFAQHWVLFFALFYVLIIKPLHFNGEMCTIENSLQWLISATIRQLPLVVSCS